MFNKLLSALPVNVYQRLSPYLTEVSLVQGQTLHQPGEIIQSVYFPHQASVSIVVSLSDKSTVEVAVIGYEGLVGLPIILGAKSSTNYSIVQISGKAIKIESQILVEEFNKGKELQNLLLLYTQAQLNQISQIATCQSHHIIEQRLARWLLLVSHCTKKSKLPLTQKLISMMLGVRRASITEAAISLQKAEILTYSRGKIVILDRTKLESAACECYSKIIQEYNRLLD